MKRFLVLLAVFAAVAVSQYVVATPACRAADGSAAETQEPVVAPVEASPQPAVDPGHNAWMMVCTALVLFMTAPGLALFYGGLVRKKNVLGVMMQCIFLMGLMTVIWALWGYTLSFGGDQADVAPKWIGSIDYLAMNGVQLTWNESTGDPTNWHGERTSNNGPIHEGCGFLLTAV